MIERYSRPEMRAVWTEQNKFDAYLKVELLSAEAWRELGVVPPEDIEKLYAKATFSIPRIKEIEEQTRHDIVAFTRAVSESLGEERKWVHYGLTSTDVVDTANGYLIKQANDILRRDLVKFSEMLRSQAMKYKDTPCMGRTHGIHADVTSFGLKWTLWYQEMQRNIARFEEAARGVEVGKISGAVGNYANIPPFVQQYVCEHLGIESAAVSTQVIQRDRHAWYLAAIALIGASIEQMAMEVRNLQRTEVHEVEEAFGKGQKGSSAMPHKRNPIGSENMCGCARDISHSSTERIILPDATELLDYMLNRMGNILGNLTVFPERMKSNIYMTNGVIFAQRVMNALINKGFSREKAYDTVQPLAMKAMAEGKPYAELLAQDPTVSQNLTCFTLDYYFKNVDYIYKQVFGDAE